MDISRIEPPRTFRVGHDQSIELSHVADIELEPDEQITFVTHSGTEFDVVRKEWGYYATPSLDRRLPDHGLRPALVRGSRTGRMYLLLVEVGKEADFQSYLEWDGLQLVCWLDRPEATAEVAVRLGPDE
jgi:hypothetical protein